MIVNDPGDVANLAARFPPWKITVSWVTAATGPDHRLIVAQRGSLIITGHSPADLDRQIEQAERGRARQ